MDFLNIQNLSTVIGDFFLGFGNHHPAVMMIIIFLKGGWVFFAIVILLGLWDVYMLAIQTKYAEKIKWTLLALDVPKENLQSTKAVENIFAALWPFYESINLVEKYIEGKFQQAISLEIVSIGGYTQFLIRTPITHKDMVEAAVYAQYPKAEITEVEDYTARYKDLEFPSEDWDMFGSEFGLMKPSPYPIRTYPAFEHALSQTFADPMASVLEVFAKINKDEELWLQFVITPIKDGWKEEGYKIINKIIGAKEEKKKGFFDSLLYPFYYFFTLVQEMMIYGMGYEPGEAGGAGSKAEGANEPPNKMLYLTPEEKNVIEGITAKMSKLAWQTKCRFVYLSPKGKMNKAKGAGAVIGALQQFSTIDQNQFVPVMPTMTKANYFFVKRRIVAKQNKLLANFISRAQSGGWGSGFVLNIEELASVFHFPIPEAIKEAVKQVEAKKEAAPTELPDQIFQAEEEERYQNEMTERAGLGGSATEDKAMGRRRESSKEEPPSNLPV